MVGNGPSGSKLTSSRSISTRSLFALPQRFWWLSKNWIYLVKFKLTHALRFLATLPKQTEANILICYYLLWVHVSVICQRNGLWPDTFYSQKKKIYFWTYCTIDALKQEVAVVHFSCNALPAIVWSMPSLKYMKPRGEVTKQLTQSSDCDFRKKLTCTSFL